MFSYPGLAPLPLPRSLTPDPDLARRGSRRFLPHESEFKIDISVMPDAVSPQDYCDLTGWNDRGTSIARESILHKHVFADEINGN